MSNRDPMYGTMTAALINGSAMKGSPSSKTFYSSSFSNVLSGLPVEQVVGISAVAGTGLIVVMYAIRSGSKEKDDGYDDDGSGSMGRATSLSLLGIMRRILRRLLLEDPEASRDSAALDKNDATATGDGKIISHQGSCHCESIQFQVLAPRCLIAKEGPGKIQYRHTQINAVNFRVFAGHECLKTYYVFRGNARKGAHAFCERCGVHVLYAPSKNTPLLNINVNCLLGNGISKVKVVSKNDDISEGFPADGQWDTSDQLSTISEVTQPFHFQLSHMHHHNSDSGDWKSYHRGMSSDLYSVGERGKDDDDDDDDDDEGDSRSIPIRKVSVPPPNPITPTTISSSTMEMDREYNRQLAQLKMMAPSRAVGSVNSLIDDLTNDDISLSDETTLSSAHQKLMASGTLRRNRPPRYSTSTTAASSPEMRNKMRYFMGKYKHQQHHDSSGSSGTSTTAASSMTTEFN